MTRRRREITRGQLNRQWPHHVELPAEALHGAVNSMRIYALAKGLQGAPRPYRLEREDHDYVVFCFATAEAAQAFHERFGGQLLPVTAKPR
jgi:hypothetical protein